MNPAQPNVPNAKDARFRALEQAYADSLAVQENTQKQIDALLKSFQHLEKLMQAITPSTPPQICLANPTPVHATPIGRPPLRHCLVNMMEIDPEDSPFLPPVKHIYASVQICSQMNMSKSLGPCHT